MSGEAQAVVTGGGAPGGDGAGGAPNAPNTVPVTTPKAGEGGDQPNPENAGRAEALKLLREQNGTKDAVPDRNVKRSEDQPDPEKLGTETKVDEKKPDAKVDEKKPDEPGEKPKWTKENRQKTLAEMTEGMSEQEKNDFFAASNDAFAALQRKRVEFRAQVDMKTEEIRQHEQKKLEWETQQKTRDAEYSQWEEALKRGKSDPEFWLQLGGWTAEKIREFHANGGRRPEHQLREEFEREQQLTRKQIEEKLERDRAEREAQTAKEREEEAVRVWNEKVAAGVHSVSAESHPHLYDFMDALKEEGRDPHKAVMVDVLRVQNMAFKGELQGLTGETLPPETVLDTRVALKYLDARLLKHKKLLTREKPQAGGGRPDTERAGAESTATPEGKKEATPPVPTLNGQSERDAARAEARKLVRAMHTG